MKIETLRLIIKQELRSADVHPLREEKILRWIDIYEKDNLNWYRKLLRKLKKHLR